MLGSSIRENLGRLASLYAYVEYLSGNSAVQSRLYVWRVYHSERGLLSRVFAETTYRNTVFCQPRWVMAKFAANSPLKNSDLRKPVLFTGLFVATVLFSEGRRYTRIASVLAPRFRQEASIFATEQFFTGLLRRELGAGGVAAVDDDRRTRDLRGCARD